MMIYAGLKKSVVKDMRMQKITDISAANMAADLKKAQQAQEWLSKLVVSGDSWTTPLPLPFPDPLCYDPIGH